MVRVLTLPLQAHHAMEKMEEFVYKVWEGAVMLPVLILGWPGCPKLGLVSRGQGLALSG